MFTMLLFMLVVNVGLVVLLLVGINSLVVAPPLHILAVYSKVRQASVGIARPPAA